MIQFATHVGLDLQPVEFRQTAPVQRRTKVMGCMESVVQEKPIEPTPRDIAGMVKCGGLVAILMLKQVDRNDPPLSKQPGNSKINQRGPPI